MQTVNIQFRQLFKPIIIASEKQKVSFPCSQIAGRTERQVPRPNFCIMQINEPEGVDEMNNHGERWKD